MAAMSLACDTGMGVPLETGLATCLVAVGIGSAAGFSPAELDRTYRLAMLQHVGCTMVASENAAIMGDELVLRHHAAIADLSDNREVVRFLLAHVARVNPLLSRPVALFRAISGGRRLLATTHDVCEAGKMLGRRCGYDAAWLQDLDAVYEYWDGSGLPGALSGDAIPLPVQAVQVASLAVNAERLLGADGAAALIRVRRGHAVSPSLSDVFLADPAGLLAMAQGDSLFERVVAAEPNPGALPTPVDVEEALSAVADFADLSTPCLIGHSVGVARLASAAARRCGVSAEAQERVRWAGYVHDVGRVSVSATVWNSTRPLRADQRERIRMHPYHTQRVLQRVSFLRPLSEIASCHHERLDGSGYFRGATGASLSTEARLLAAADTLRTKLEPRPHRAALELGAAAAHVRADAAAGRLDATAVEAVLEAMGHPVSRTHPHLTAREIEILVAAARGGTIREIARLLGIAPKTVDGHLQRIYPKIGTSTRAGATLYVLQHGLLPAAVGPEMGENSP